MALVRKLEKLAMSRNSVHDEAECTHTIFRDNVGKCYLQIDTYGSPRRQLHGKKASPFNLGQNRLWNFVIFLKTRFLLNFESHHLRPLRERLGEVGDQVALVLDAG